MTKAIPCKGVDASDSLRLELLAACDSESLRPKRKKSETMQSEQLPKP